MKKKILSILTGVFLVAALTACGDQTEEIVTDRPTEQTEEQTEEPAAEPEADASAGTASNVLVAYFTFPETDGTDASSGASRRVVDGEVVGSTQVIAEMIQGTTGGDLFAIETVQEYPGAHDPLVDFAADEQDENARPELSTQVENMDQYDTIYIGYPNWWGDMPMPLYTFLEEYDLAGKTIVPFNTHGGSSFSGTIDTISSLQPDATVIENGFTMSREDDITEAQSEVDEWLQGLGI